MNRIIEPNQILWLIAVFTIILIASTLLAPYLKTNVSGLARPIFTNSTITIGYIAFIALAGFGMAILIKHQKHMKRHINRLSAWLAAHRHQMHILYAIITILAAMAILVLYLQYALRGSIQAAEELVALYALIVFVVELAILYLCMVFVLSFIMAKLPKNRWWKDVGRTASTAGTILLFIIMGAYVGALFQFQYALLFMALLAIYDFIAVFITKHMQVLASALMGEGRPQTGLFGLVSTRIIPLKEQMFGMKERNVIRVLKKKMQRAKFVIVNIYPNGIMVNGKRSKFRVQGYEGKQFTMNEQRQIREIYSQKQVPYLARIMVGNGDIVFSAGVVAAAGLTGNVVLAAYMVVGAVLGLSSCLAMLDRAKNGLPAIPFLLGGIGLAFGLYLLSSTMALQGMDFILLSFMATAAIITSAAKAGGTRWAGKR